MALSTNVYAGQPNHDALHNEERGLLNTHDSKLATIASGATANDTDVNLRNRATHTGTQTSATISDFAAAVTGLVNTNPNLDPPSGLTASTTSGATTLTWIAAAGAASYAIFRRTNATGSPLQLLGFTTATSFVDSAPGATVWVYQVRSLPWKMSSPSLEVFGDGTTNDGSSFLTFDYAGNLGTVGSTSNLGVSDWIVIPGGVAKTVTATASTDVITSNGHGWANGTPAAWSGAAPAGMTANTTYYVVNSQTNTFQLSTTLGGTAVDITADATNLKIVNYGTGQLKTGATAAASTDLVTLTAHGWGTGMQVQFVGTAPAPLVVGTTYYLVNVTTNSFGVAATFGGAAIDITADATGLSVQNLVATSTPPGFTVEAGGVFHARTAANPTPGSAGNNATLMLQKTGWTANKSWVWEQDVKEDSDFGDITLLFSTDTAMANYFQVKITYNSIRFGHLIAGTFGTDYTLASLTPALDASTTRKLKASFIVQPDGTGIFSYFIDGTQKATFTLAASVVTQIPAGTFAYTVSANATNLAPRNRGVIGTGPNGSVGLMRLTTPAGG